MDNYNLTNEWVIYFHDFMDTNWNRESYEKLVSIDNVVDFWTIFNVIKEKLSVGMFFFMKTNIFPKWDDNENTKMSYMSIKILKTNASVFMEKILVHLMTDTLYMNNPHLINGLSISPKKNFCICKIWINSIEDVHKNIELYNIPDVYHGECLFNNF
tara:strand:+ start:3737 stop:4207 length:471 start_codon:yes stop_codon:yes gene_type:complete